MFLGAEKVDKSTSSLSLLIYVKTLILVCVNDSVPIENCLIMPSYHIFTMNNWELGRTIFILSRQSDSDPAF